MSIYVLRGLEFFPRTLLSGTLNRESSLRLAHRQERNYLDNTRLGEPCKRSQRCERISSNLSYTALATVSTSCTSHREILLVNHLSLQLTKNSDCQKFEEVTVNFKESCQPSVFNLDKTYAQNKFRHSLGQKTIFDLHEYKTNVK